MAIHLGDVAVLYFPLEALTNQLDPAYSRKGLKPDLADFNSFSFVHRYITFGMVSCQRTDLVRLVRWGS